MDRTVHRWVACSTLIAFGVTFIPTPAYAPIFRPIVRPPVEVRPYRPYEPPRNVPDLQVHPEGFPRELEPKTTDPQSLDTFRILKQEHPLQLNEELGGSFNVRDDAPPDARRRYLATNAIFFALPTSETEYRAVFGTDAIISEPVVKELDELKGTLPAGIPNRELTAATFETLINKTTATYVTVVGHNEHGDFKFLDGSRQSLDTLAKICRAAARICIFISCRSAQYVEPAGGLGVTHDLTFTQALAVSKNLSNYFTAQPQGAQASPDDIRTHVLERNGAGLPLSVQFIVTATSALIVAIVISEARSPTPRPDGGS